MGYAMKFFEGYRDCALWASTDDEGKPLDSEFTVDDLSPGAIQTMRQDCAAFIRANREDLRASELSPERAGHDFWLTRNGHGAGFWDEGLGDLGRELTKASKPYGEAYLYAGDDGQVHHG